MAELTDKTTELADKITEEKPLETKPKNKGGRPLGSKGIKISEKTRLLSALKKIWSHPLQYKASEVVAAANLYAELNGWKLRKPEVTDSGEVMKIEFEKDIIKSPEVFPVIKIAPKEVLLTHAQGSMGITEVKQDISEVVNTSSTVTTTSKVELDFK